MVFELQIISKTDTLTDLVLIREEFERGHMVVWDRNIYSHGAFVQQEPFQKYNFMVIRLIFLL